MKLKKSLYRLLSVLVLIGVLLSLPSCKPSGDEPNDEPPAPTGPKEYSISVKSEYGLALSGVYILVHDEASSNPNSTVARAQTDKSGNAKIELEQSKTYTLRLMELNAGYDTETRYPLNKDGATEIRVKSAPITTGSPRDVEYYALGDVVHDIKLTDLGGVERSIGEVLKEKDLLILNFWFAGCGPCKSEFPHFITTYGSDENRNYEIFAINDNGESIGILRDFTVNVGGSAVKLPFPTFKADGGDNAFYRNELILKFGSNAYPTTVFIDRAGVVCYTHDGELDASRLNALIEHFTSENYEQRLGNNIWNG